LLYITDDSNWQWKPFDCGFEQVSSAFEQIDLVSDEGLHELEFNEGLLYIGERAFYKNQLTRLDLPYSVSYIGEDAFAENPLK